jgi:hypothetical protein
MPGSMSDVGGPALGSDLLFARGQMANHVWLILVVVLLFTAFPAAFAAASIALHMPLTLLLLGIVARRGSRRSRAPSAG